MYFKTPLTDHPQQDHRSLIIGGQDAPKGRYPYFASFDHWGGGVLIAPDIILTAGHCNPPPEQPVKVRVNHYKFQSNDLSQEPDDDETFSIVTKERHPNWYTISWDEAVNDFNIFKLSGFSKVPPVKLNRNPNVPVAGDRVTVIGMGSTDPNPETFEATAATTLQQVQLKIMAHDKCEASHDPKRPNTTYAGRIFEDRMVCTSGGHRNERDACAFDSGSPLLMSLPITMDDNNTETTSNNDDDYQDVVVGVVSWGEDCADPYFPAVNARVSFAMDWISKTVCELSDADPSQLTDFGCDGTEHKKAMATSTTSLGERIRRWFSSWAHPPKSTSTTATTTTTQQTLVEEGLVVEEEGQHGISLLCLRHHPVRLWCGILMVILLAYRYYTRQQDANSVLPSYWSSGKQDSLLLKGTPAQLYGSMISKENQDYCNSNALDGIQTYGWVPSQELSHDDNMLDLLLLITRNSICREGHMGCILTRPFQQNNNCDSMTTPLSNIPNGTDMLLDSIVAVSNNGPFYSATSSDVHAEIVGVGKCARQGISTHGCTAYVTMAPCKNCLAALVKAGIRRIVYFRKTPLYLEEIAQQADHKLVLQAVSHVSDEQKARMNDWVAKYKQQNGGVQEEEEIARQRLERKREKKEKAVQKEQRILQAQQKHNKA